MTRLIDAVKPNPCGKSCERMLRLEEETAASQQAAAGIVHTIEAYKAAVAWLAVQTGLSPEAVQTEILVRLGKGGAS